ncbi:MAG: hypothetical protein GXX92_03880 [Clostridiales bacterium]|nr:hypothetical protein [Clostridiales bacterium]
MHRKLIQPFNNNRGIVLVFVVMLFLLLSLIGTSMLVAASRNQQTAVQNRDFESVYYIAEAGVNKTAAALRAQVDSSDPADDPDSFFSALEDDILGTTVLDDFEESFGSQPVAVVDVSLAQIVSANVRRYRISSEGTINGQSRSAEALLLAEWIPPTLGIASNFVYSGSFSFTGSSIMGDGATANVNGNVKASDFNGGGYIGVSNLFINGDANMADGGATVGSMTSPGVIYINGDLTLSGGVKMYGDVYVAGNLISGGSGTVNGKVYVQGNATMTNGIFNDDVYIAGNTYMKDITSNSKIYVGGNLQVGWEPKGSFTVDYVGTLTKPAGITRTCTKVASIPAIPTFTIPTYDVTLKEDSWYTDNGYTLGGNVTQNTMPDNLKILANNYTSKGWQASVPSAGALSANPDKHVIIVSKGNITIEGKANLVGVLLAPYGKITLNQGGSTFTGVAISKDGFFFKSGGSYLHPKTLNDYFDSLEDMPVMAEDTTSGTTDPSEDPSAGGTPGTARTTLYPVVEK